VALKATTINNNNNYNNNNGFVTSEALAVGDVK